MATSMADLDDDMEKDTRKGLALLSDGEHDFVIVNGVQRDTASGPVVSLKMTVVGGVHDGLECEHSYFLCKKDGTTNTMKRDELKKDLSELGFDVENWTKANERPFSTQLVLAMDVIGGVGFRGKKKQNGTFTNLEVKDRSKTDGRPEAFGPAELSPEAVKF